MPVDDLADVKRREKRFHHILVLSESSYGWESRTPVIVWLLRLKRICVLKKTFLGCYYPIKYSGWNRTMCSFMCEGIVQFLSPTNGDLHFRRHVVLKLFIGTVNYCIQKNSFTSQIWPSTFVVFSSFYFWCTQVLGIPNWAFMQLILECTLFVVLGCQMTHNINHDKKVFLSDSFSFSA